MKLELNDLKTVVFIASTAVGALLWADGHYAKAADASKTHEEIRKEIIVNELRQIEAKQIEQGKLADWEKLRYNDLQRQLKDLMEQKK